MKLTIDKKILEDFPEAKIGWLRARITNGNVLSRVAEIE